VILATGNQQQGRAIVVVEVHGGWSVWVEVGERRLEQNVIGSGDRVSLVDRQGLFFGQRVANT
jgi:hypothetical protein